MTETTVLLNLPLRGIVLSAPGNESPEWLDDEFRRMPARLAGLHLARIEAAAAARTQQEIELLCREREAWSRGLQELRRQSGQLDLKLTALLNDVREATVELAHAIASKLVFQQITSDAFPVDRLVTEVLARLATREPATVRLHPDDLEIIQSHPEYDANPNHEREVRLIPDSSLSRGDCKATAGEITVVYELKRQIDEIRSELLSTVSGHAESGH